MKAQHRERVIKLLGPLVLIVGTTAIGSCVHRPAMTPETGAPPLVIHVQPEHEWTDSGLTVHRDDWLFITATGDVSWSARKKSVGPNGVNGSPGWPVGGGGLVGRVDGTTKAFDIGARTERFRYRNARSRATFEPPPVHMPADGHLLLGFKDFKPGANTGEFLVTIRRAK